MAAGESVYEKILSSSPGTFRSIVSVVPDSVRTASKRRSSSGSMNSFRIPRRLRACWRAASVLLDEPNNDIRLRVFRLMGKYSSTNSNGVLYPNQG